MTPDTFFQGANDQSSPSACSCSWSRRKKKDRQLSTLHSFAGRLKEDLDFGMQEESAGCDMEVAPHNGTNAKSNMNDLIKRLLRETFKSYASI